MMKSSQNYLTQVRGHNNLFRNEATGMIVSINKHSSSHYKKQRELKMKEKKELAELKTEVGDIKSMLKQLLEKING